MAGPLLELQKIGKYYTGNRSVVVGLSEISLTLERGEFVAVTGESGSGKSTLANVLGGILPYESGEMLYMGRPTSHYDGSDWERFRRDQVSFISQNYGILPGDTVLGNVSSALRLAGMDRGDARREAEKILRKVELWPLRRRRAARLSSGQKQRLSIARALAKPTPILIADEPTGNLDAENSAKVIDLLADAAKERLVVLVTHEFDEAKDKATRHIVIQEGKVASDTALRPAPVPEAAPEQAKKGRRRPLSPYVAGLQVRSRPLWSALTAMIFALTAFAVFAFLGVFIISLDDTSTRVYDPSAFRNGSMTRLIASFPESLKADREQIYEEILKIPHVSALEVWGDACDAQYGYREGVDLISRNTVIEERDENGEPVTSVRTDIIVAREAPFVTTVPMLPGGREPALTGRLPESFHEVLSADPDLAIGDRVTVYFTDLNAWNVEESVEVEMTVVGTTDYGEGLVFHEDVGRFFRQGMQLHGGLDDPYRYLYLPMADLAELAPAHLVQSYRYSTGLLPIEPRYADGWYRGNYHYSTSYYRVDSGETNTYFTDNQNMPRPDIFHSELFASLDPDAPSEELLLLRLGRSDSENAMRPSRVVEVSPELFDKLTWATPTQVSVFIEDYAYTDRVLDKLQGLGLLAVSVYRLGATEQVPQLAAERSQTLKVCLLALIAVALLQVVLLRVMFSVQTDAFRLLANIGLTGRTARRALVWELVGFTLVGQALGVTGILIAGRAGVERIAELIRNLPLKYALLLSAVHIALTALAAVWVLRSLSRQVFPMAERYTDLDLDDEEVEA